MSNVLYQQTRRTVIKPGAAKPYMESFVKIPAFRIPQYVDPNYFKTNTHYNIFMGYEGPEILRADDDGDMF